MVMFRSSTIISDEPALDNLRGCEATAFSHVIVLSSCDLRQSLCFHQSEHGVLL